MSNIKTLKDCKMSMNTFLELKAEAVKWVNYRISMKFNSLLTGNESADEEIKAKKDLAMYGDGEIRFWMKRLNLKEEDLE